MDELIIFRRNPPNKWLIDPLQMKTLETSEVQYRPPFLNFLKNDFMYYVLIFLLILTQYLYLTQDKVYMKKEKVFVFKV